MRDESTTPEEWRSIPDLVGLYEVSNLGGVRRVGKIPGRAPRNQNGPIATVPTPGRYVMVQLWINGRRTGRGVHQLVAAAFIGPRPEGHQVNHIDGNKHNNIPSNLEYVTPARNSEHAFELGLRLAVRGEDHGLAVLTNDQVSEIRRITAATPLTRKAPPGGRARGIGKEALIDRLAIQYRVSRAVIHGIVYGRKWKHVR